MSSISSDISTMTKARETLNNVQGNSMKVDNSIHHYYRPNPADIDGSRRQRSTPSAFSRVSSGDRDVPPNERYSRLLMEEHRGYPSYYPEPTDEFVDQHTARDVDMIGSVGILAKDGSFDLLFSIMHPPGDPINRNGVPQTFEQLSERLEKRGRGRFHNDDHHLCSPQPPFLLKEMVFEQGNAGEAQKGFRFSCGYGITDGAILVLPDGCSRIDLANKNPFINQAIKHGASWFDYAESRGRPTASLYLITGCDRASSWGIASFAKDPNAALQLTLNENINASGRTTYKWSNNPWGSTRCSPETRRHSEIPASHNHDNQCIFLRGFTISRYGKSDHIKREDVEDIGSMLSYRTNRSSFSSRSQDAVNLTLCAPDDTPYHPGKHLNLYLHHLLRASFVGEDQQLLSDEIPIIIISHDDNWCTSPSHASQGDDWGACPKQYPLTPGPFRRLCESLKVEIHNNIVHTSSSQLSKDLASLMSQQLHVAMEVPHKSVSDTRAKANLRSDETNADTLAPSADAAEGETQPHTEPYKQAQEESTQDDKRPRGVKRPKSNSPSPTPPSTGQEAPEQPDQLESTKRSTFMGQSRSGSRQEDKAQPGPSHGTANTLSFGGSDQHPAGHISQRPFIGTTTSASASATFVDVHDDDDDDDNPWLFDGGSRGESVLTVLGVPAHKRRPLLGQGLHEGSSRGYTYDPVSAAPIFQSTHPSVSTTLVDESHSHHQSGPGYTYTPAVSRPDGGLNGITLYSPGRDPSSLSTSEPRRPYSCDLCALSFNRQHDLKRHRETHTGEKPYTCNGGCGKTFTRKDALKRHQLVKGCGKPDEGW
ncbi:hypothetical protein VNI00_009685 [Paramarasmius palmivorus]|uniref:C2H2-type domain-containing protein n=1 Tax=Paramarasmius palmivorus TaxID=297713 RepID=A0AAW0CQ64_9AGAR